MPYRQPSDLCNGRGTWKSLKINTLLIWDVFIFAHLQRIVERSVSYCYCLLKDTPTDDHKLLHLSVVELFFLLLFVNVVFDKSTLKPNREDFDLKSVHFWLARELLSFWLNMRCRRFIVKSHWCFEICRTCKQLLVDMFVHTDDISCVDLIICCAK